MYIKFESIEIENFQSIGKANIKLSGRGTVLIKGINNYESKAKSNGSGKSSCIEAIYFAIYGKTSSGVTNPSNRYAKSGYLVKLKFFIDNQEYTIIRANKHNKYKTCVIILKGDKDISGRNKTDTDKMIKSDIFPVSQDIFLSSIFLSQGFSSRLSNLTPTGRKERIEVLTDTSSRIETFKDKISLTKSKFNNKYNKLLSDESYNRGLQDNVNNQISTLTREIEEVSKKRPIGDIDNVLKNICKLEDIISNIDNEINNLRNKYNSVNKDINSIKSEQSLLVSSMKNIEQNKSKLISSKGSVCPTCGQSITDENKIDSLISNYDNDYESLISNHDLLVARCANLYDDLNKLDLEINTLLTKKTNLHDKLSSLRKLYSELCKYRDVKEDQKKLLELKASLVDISDRIKSISINKESTELLRDIANHCITLVSKPFRGYLLQNTIDFINERLYKYSEMLFSNNCDIIKLLIDSSKLDIYLGDALYDTLSGGEKRKVDLAIVLAQRDLALNIANFSCNMLIMDEIYDGLDDSAINIVTDMFSEVSSEIDSMFIISHKPEAEIPYDSIITVTKGSDRISVVKDY